MTMRMMSVVGLALTSGCLTECYAPVEEKAPAVCETGERVAFVRVTRPAVEMLGGGAGSPLPEPNHVQVILANPHLGDQEVVWSTSEYIRDLAYHCGTGRIAVLSGDRSVQVQVITRHGERVFAAHASGYWVSGLSLSPDGRFVAVNDKVWDLDHDGAETSVSTGDSYPQYVWARDSSGLHVHESNSSEALWFLPLTGGSNTPAEHPTCFPGTPSSTTGNNTRTTEITETDDLHVCALFGREYGYNGDCAAGGCALPSPQPPKGRCQFRLQVKESNAGLDYDHVTWSPDRPTGFPGCP